MRAELANPELNDWVFPAEFFDAHNAPISGLLMPGEEIVAVDTKTGQCLVKSQTHLTHIGVIAPIRIEPKGADSINRKRRLMVALAAEEGFSGT